MNIPTDDQEVLTQYSVNVVPRPDTQCPRYPQYSGTISTPRTLTFQKNCFVCFKESHLKMMKKAFYFILKPLFIFKIFIFSY